MFPNWLQHEHGCVTVAAAGARNESFRRSVRSLKAVCGKRLPAAAAMLAQRPHDARVSGAGPRERLRLRPKCEAPHPLQPIVRHVTAGARSEQSGPPHVRRRRVAELVPTDMAHLSVAVPRCFAPTPAYTQPIGTSCEARPGRSNGSSSSSPRGRRSPRSTGSPLSRRTWPLRS